MKNLTNIIAVIPARGGSKSIPKKNIKLLAGKPLIAYPIELANSVKDITRVIVSTDSEEIAEIAKKTGAEVPFFRPQELSKDETGTLHVLQHCVDYLEKIEKYKSDIVVLLYPTCPMLNKERVQQAINILKTKQYNSVVSVVEDSGRYFVFDETEKRYVRLYPARDVNRQYYKPLYKENGAIYFSNYETLMIKNKLIDYSNPYFLVMNSEEVVDIDTPEDWKKTEDMINLKRK